MGFDQRQRKALKAKLRFAHVRTRVSNGTKVHYIEGWQVVAEANRIFGHENWDRETRAPTCIWSDRHRGQVACLFRYPDGQKRSVGTNFMYDRGCLPGRISF